MTTADRPLDGLAVIVTGAAQGIGRAYATDLAALGANVVVNDINVDGIRSVVEDITSAGGQAVDHAADVSDERAAEGLIQACIAQFGRIDGLVNNAALMSNDTVDEYDAEKFRRLLSVNVVGLANCTAAALRPMLAASSGSIVNTVSGAHLGMEHMGMYGATKGAVASLTYTWALETKASGVRINAVSPWAHSGMSAETEIYQADHGLPPIELSTFPQPSSNTPAVAYLLSPLSSHLTGQLVRIQGTILALMTHPAVASPLLERDSWDVDSIDRAFTDYLNARMSPLGVAYGDPATQIAPTPLSTHSQSARRK